MRHWSQASIIIAAVSIAIVTESVLGALLLLLAGEAVLIGLCPLLPSFQRQAQELFAREARASVIADRARLVPGMAPEHRGELDVLESFAAVIRTRTGCGIEREDWLGIDGLLTLYMRLAVAHRQNTHVLSLEPPANLERQLAMVERARAAAPEARREHIDQHLAILQRRCELRTKTEERRSTIACDLAALADLVRCLHDECVSVDGASLSSEVPEAIADGLRSAAVLSELAMLHSVDVPIAIEPAVDEALEADPERRRHGTADAPRQFVLPSGAHGVLIDM